VVVSQFAYHRSRNELGIPPPSSFEFCRCFRIASWKPESPTPGLIQALQHPLSSRAFNPPFFISCPSNTAELSFAPRFWPYKKYRVFGIALFLAWGYHLPAGQLHTGEALITRDQRGVPETSTIGRPAMKTHKPNFVTFIAVALVSSLVTVLLMLGTSSSSARQQQQFTGTENHVVTLDQAVKFVQNYSTNPTVPTIKGGFFARSIFDKILAQNGCVGIRIYYAKKDDGSPAMVLVGVDTYANDMTGGTVGELLYPCPPFCGQSVLNK
jgi:hypothetical protein